MPSTPKILDTPSKIWPVKINREVDIENPGDAAPHIRIARKVAVYSHPKSKRGNNNHQAGLPLRLTKYAISKESEIISNYNFLEEPYQEQVDPALKI